jgi:hypothetical protein
MAVSKKQFLGAKTLLAKVILMVKCLEEATGFGIIHLRQPVGDKWVPTTFTVEGSEYSVKDALTKWAKAEELVFHPGQDVFDVLIEANVLHSIKKPGKKMPFYVLANSNRGSAVGSTVDI